jgi:hypothetical protein
MIRNSFDRSYYFKGVLLLVRKDEKISVEEKELLMKIGIILRFNQRPVAFGPDLFLSDQP